jgi:hypothetical protein
MQSSEHIAALIAQHVAAPRRLATLPGPGPGAPPPLPRMRMPSVRRALEQAVDVTAYAVDDEDGVRISAWSKWRSRLGQLRWPIQLRRLNHEVSVRVGIGVVALGLGLLIGARPWQASAPSSKTRMASAPSSKARMASASAHRAARSAATLAARAALTTAGATAASAASLVQREGTRKVNPVRIVASSQRSLKADARADKRKAPAKRWGQSRR